MSKDNDIPELTHTQKTPGQPETSDLSEISARVRDDSATREDTHCALTHLRPDDIDQDTLLNSLHMPPDAGPYAAALDRILRRIPDGWGRWISHDAGWYPIVATLDDRLTAIDPDYVAHQVKEKFGTLRYYCAPSEPSTELREAFCDIIGEAERMSAVTCERCGEPGVAQRRGHWRKTLCASCAEKLHYTSIPPRNDR
ncbi:hypothetical protein AWC29_11345 [Mycobacterium triplex]|uniref:Uncharacterized protein n=2 Tax=Mycobacterium simiae complex TaxID=2249310 RepID=A0A0E3WEE6_MYCLN|nr:MULTISPECIES: hypothetical protein [Mycobacterium simiae complex]ORX05428.1 hypothetical protein AWC29_11345 [Mycobacterium triplex]ULP45550.1 hypothetical protein MJO58_27800 [Mycobacterium lentiflavum]CDO91620.1 hypothetical protein BN973_06029 [Mycobacterium triplex]CQD24710.1 hypothetical protein BN1232_06339 [Mycobacterium lentiflavum]